MHLDTILVLIAFDVALKTLIIMNKRNEQSRIIEIVARTSAQNNARHNLDLIDLPAAHEFPTPRVP